MRVDGADPSFAPNFDTGSNNSTEDQLKDAMSVPVRAHDHPSANARRDSVRDIFAKLPADEAKEMYGRLQKYNHKDSLADKFYGTFSQESIDSLKNTLKSRFEPEAAGTGQAAAGSSADSATRTAKKTEVNIAGQTRARDLNDQLKPKGPDAPLKISSSKGLNENEKQNAIYEWMRTAPPDEFQKAIEQSGSWPKDVQQRMDGLIDSDRGGGVLAQRLLTDLKPSQQVDMIKRLHGEGHQNALTTLLGGADKSVLNQVAADVKSYPGLHMDSNKNKASGAMIDVLAMRSGELTPDNQHSLADTIINHGMPQEPAAAGRAFYLEDMFHSLNDAQSKDVFAHIQNNGDLKKMLANFQDKPINFQKEFLGLGKKEIQAAKQTFEELAAEQPKGSALEKTYSDSARSAAHWL